MKFKENLDLNSVRFCDDIEKMLGKETAKMCLGLEKTAQDFWNLDRTSANFLSILIKLKNVKSALEIGTSNGYSAIWIANALRSTGGRLITIEYWQKRLDLAILNFKKACLEDIITPIVGDAVEILKDMKDKGAPQFDFIFVDANKAEYIEYFRLYDSLLEAGGVIIADNILSHYHKTKDFVDEIFKNKNYNSQILNIDTGMLLSVKVKDPLDKDIKK